MLSICFLDPKNWDYNVDAPAKRPLGGSESALCYLAVELARLGHHVTLLTGTKNPGRVAGVDCLHRRVANPGFFAERKFDAVIVATGMAELSAIRWELPASTSLIFWTQLAVDQPALQGLRRRNTRKKWDYVVAVSEWHRRSIIDTFQVDEDRIFVMKNAIAPAFENLFASRDDLTARKSEGLRLTYTSTPFRGLDLLLRIFPEIRQRRPEATLDVYSSMTIYQDDVRDTAAPDLYRPLYELAKATKGVNYVGPVPQRELAQALSRSHCLSYPNTFAETSCIAVMEALAAGQFVVTSALGALPETTQGFARLIPFDPRNVDQYVDEYTKALDESLAANDAINGLFEQIVHMNQHYTWRVRAQEWADFLTNPQARAHIA